MLLSSLNSGTIKAEPYSEINYESFAELISQRNSTLAEILKTEQPIGFEYFEYFKKEEVQSEMS